MKSVSWCLCWSTGGGTIEEPTALPMSGNRFTNKSNPTVPLTALLPIAGAAAPELKDEVKGVHANAGSRLRSLSLSLSHGARIGASSMWEPCLCGTLDPKIKNTTAHHRKKPFRW